MFETPVRSKADRGLALYFGTAGWSYADWQGIVYPRPRPRAFHPVTLLADLFDTVEVNVTFYRDIGCDQLVRWCRLVEDKPGFRWCFKLHQRLSHGGAVPAPKALLTAAAAYEPVREAGRLGALLLQFPWSLRQNPGNRQRIAELMEAARQTGWPLVVEVRHRSWNGTEPAFPPVICDQPFLRGNLTADESLQAALQANGLGAGPTYIRLHGHNRSAWFDSQAGRDERYNYLYAPAERAGWIERLRHLERQLPAGEALFLIANNHFRGQAVVDALLLQKLWSGHSPPLPPQLKSAYRRELAGFPVADTDGDEPSAPGTKPPTLF